MASGPTITDFHQVADVRAVSPASDRWRARPLPRRVRGATGQAGPAAGLDPPARRVVLRVREVRGSPGRIGRAAESGAVATRTIGAGGPIRIERRRFPGGSRARVVAT